MDKNLMFESAIPSNSSTQSSNTGYLQVAVFANEMSEPVPNAKINVYESGTKNAIDTLITDISGQSNEIALKAPNLDYSLDESNSSVRPYSEYDIEVISLNNKPIRIEKIQILPTSTAFQNINLSNRNIFTQKISPDNILPKQETIVIEDNVLWGKYPSKIPESETKPKSEDTGFVVLDKPVIPEFIIVHTGSPNNALAQNYWVPFKDYIKNVASSEIYSTWPRATIEANVLAILSFTLNRVYTEWYRAKGKNFTITNSTAYDHAFTYGRNIYKEISQVVDEIFNLYVTKPKIAQPLLTQYCDGKNVKCPTWMTQWGSKDLGDMGYSNIEILKSFYGQEIYLVQCQKIMGLPSSYPGHILQKGSRGEDVKIIQNELNTISKNYPAIGKVVADGIFGEITRKSVETFQKVFKLTPDSIVGSATWYKISDVYVAVTRMAELQ